MTTQTAIKTTMVLEFIAASIIRCVARKDMPEYGLTEGQCFYCVKSASSTTNEYHIVVWDYANTRWNCPCKCGEKHEHRVACKHTKAVAKDCKKAHAINSYKPRYDAVKEANEFIAKVQREKAAKAAASQAAEWGNPQVRDEAYYNAKFERDAKLQAAYKANIENARKQAAKAARKPAEIDYSKAVNKGFQLLK